MINLMVRSVGDRPPLAALARRQEYRWWVVGTVCIGAFLGQLDASIASVALPTLESVFSESIGAVAWVSLAYLIALAGLVVAFGRLADMVGRKALYALGFLVFIFGSALCGAAPTLLFLIAARVLQAVGAAMLQANSVAIITHAVEPNELARALGVQTAAQAVGLSVGPALGGLLIATLGWQWVFYIAVLPGLAGFGLGLLTLPVGRPAGRRPSFDWLGSATFGAAVAGLMYLLSTPENVGSTVFWAVLAGIGAAAAAFALIEERVKAPLIDFSLFKNLGFTAALGGALCSYTLLFSILFLVPFFLERAWGEATAATGLLMTPIPIALAAAAPVAGTLADRGYLRTIGLGSMGITLIGILLLLLTQRAESRALLIIALAAAGFGLGAFLPTNNSVVMGSAPRDRLGVTGGILNMIRGLGTALGVAASSAILTWRLSADTGRLVTGTLGVDRGALVRGFHETLLFIVGLALLTLLSALAPKKRHHRRGSPEGGLEL